MEITYIENLFPYQMFKDLIDVIENEDWHKLDDIEPNLELGRRSMRAHVDHVNNGTYEKFLIDKIDYLKENGLGLRGVTLVEYNSKYGQPNLPPHFDGDVTDVIVNYQLDSNTNWGVGVNEEVYTLVDNSAVIFNPNEDIHWRPIKEFQEGEYVRMAFFRFWNKDNPSDYSDRRYGQTDPIFDKVKAIRESGTV